MRTNMSNTHTEMTDVWKKLVAVCMVVVLGVCGLGLSACGTNDEQLIKDSFSAMIDDFKNPTEENMEPYMEDVSFEELESYGIDIYEFLGTCFKKLDYSIDSVDIDGDTAVAHLSITNVDISAAMNKAGEDFTAWMATDEGMSALAATEESGSYTEIYQKVFEFFYQEVDQETDTVTTQVDFEFTKEDGAWNPSESSINEFVSALYGGLDI
ncbi:MAG: hypothetical protein ACOX4F_04795 [Atopobiaceae bacterium]